MTRWCCSVLSRKMPTSAEIIHLSKWMFFIVKFQKIIYIQDFMFISFLNLLLEDKINYLCMILGVNLINRSNLRILVPDHYIAVTWPHVTLILGSGIFYISTPWGTNYNIFHRIFQICSQKPFFLISSPHYKIRGLSQCMQYKDYKKKKE